MGKVIVLRQPEAAAAEPKPRAKKTTTKKKNPQPELPTRPKPAPRPPAGCEYGTIGCEALRINDWERAKAEAEAAIGRGDLHLCDEHLKRLGRA